MECVTFLYQKVDIPQEIEKVIKKYLAFQRFVLLTALRWKILQK